jgi:hypothetical protein
MIQAAAAEQPEHFILGSAKIATWRIASGGSDGPDYQIQGEETQAGHDNRGRLMSLQQSYYVHDRGILAIYFGYHSELLRTVTLVGFFLRTIANIADVTIPSANLLDHR